jgi:hypothetical protein
MFACYAHSHFTLGNNRLIVAKHFARTQVLAASSGADTDETTELAHVGCFALAQACSLAWTLWIVGKLNFVKLMAERKKEANMDKVWNVRRVTKDDTLFAHLEWRGPEFYLKSLKLLLSSSMVSLSFGASLFDSDTGALNILVALCLAPSLYAISLTPTILDMYKRASAGSQDHCASASTHGSNVVQQVVQGVLGSLSTAKKQMLKDVDATAVALVTAACTAGAVHMHMGHIDGHTWSSIITHAQDNQWLRDTMILLRAVEDLPVVLRENIENMFPRAKPLIKMAPHMSHVIKMYSAMSMLN